MECHPYSSEAVGLFILIKWRMLFMFLLSYFELYLCIPNTPPSLLRRGLVTQERDCLYTYVEALNCIEMLLKWHFISLEYLYLLLHWYRMNCVSLSPYLRCNHNKVSKEREFSHNRILMTYVPTRKEEAWRMGAKGGRPCKNVSRQ